MEIAAAIVAAGGRALVASAGGPNVGRLERLGARHLTLPLASKNPLAIRANAGRLAEAIRREGVSLVHARSRAPAWSARWAARQVGVPFVTTYHGAYNENFPFKRRYNRVMASGDRVIAISHFIADLIRNRHGISADRLRVIHRGADLSVFRPDQVSASRLAAMQRAWGLREDSRIVLMPSRLTRWKGHGVLIDAITDLIGTGGHGDVVCVLLGDDAGHEDYRDELERQVKRRGLGAHVRFAPHTDDMPAALLMAEVVVSASVEPEGFGRTMAEAAAMGKPVIATAHGGGAEVVAPGETGWLVPPRNRKALAAALAAALSLTAEERSALSMKAVARVETMFSRQVMCDATLAVYRELLAR